MLTYCMNVHPGETLTEQTWNLTHQTAEIARRFRLRMGLPVDAPFGVGLRLSARAAAACVASPDAVKHLRDCCAEKGLEPFTLNAFPYGTFHNTPVKTDVYRPTWGDPRRLAYTCDAAAALAALMPDTQSHGSLSTAPLTYKRFNEATAPAVTHIVSALEQLRILHAETGKRIVLAMEPEPGCLPETTTETIQIIHRIADGAGETRTPYLGICFDTAHAAVEFEHLPSAVRQYTAAGITIAKCQISAALAATETPETRTTFARYVEETYLHQTCRRRPDGRIDRFEDLPVALNAECVPGAEWRTHFHVPIFDTGTSTLQTTRGLLADPAFRLAVNDNGCTQFEVETYSWDVWQACSGTAFDLCDGIVEELAQASAWSFV